MKKTFFYCFFISALLWVFPFLIRIMMGEWTLEIAGTTGYISSVAPNTTVNRVFEAMEVNNKIKNNLVIAYSCGGLLTMPIKRTNPVLFSVIKYRNGWLTSITNGPESNDIPYHFYSRNSSLLRPFFIDFYIGFVDYFRDKSSCVSYYNPQKHRCQ